MKKLFKTFLYNFFVLFFIYLFLFSTNEVYANTYKIENVEISDEYNTNFNKEEAEYFKNNCDFVLNLWNKTEYSEDIFSLSKSLGEGIQTIQAIEYIKKQKFDNFFKISGRYWLNDDFNFSNFDNDKLVFKKIDDNVENILTCLFKIPYSYVPSLQQFLTDNIPLMKLAL